MDTQKKILITGAAGGLGSSAVSFLIHKGWRVFATDIKEPENIPPPVTEAGYTFVPMDVTSEESVKDAFRVIKIQPGQVKSEITGSGEQQFKEADNASIHFKMGRFAFHQGAFQITGLNAF